MLRILVSLVGCRPEPEAARGEGHPPPERADTGPELLVESGAHVLDSGLDQQACVGLVPSPSAEIGAVLPIRTGPDFDFDQLGLLDAERGSHLIGYDRAGFRHPVARSVGAGSAGIRSLPTGDLVVALPEAGTLERVEYETGRSSILVGGLLSPRGLEVGTDGAIYVTEFDLNGSVRQIDPHTGRSEVIAWLRFPSGIALSADERTLYVAGPDEIAAFGREAGGGWDPEPREIPAPARGPSALATDICGNLYRVDPAGRVLRMRASDGRVDPIADLPRRPEGWAGIRFGAGLGGFGRDQLFVSDQRWIFVLEIGVDGRHVLAGE